MSMDMNQWVIEVSKESTRWKENSVHNGKVAILESSSDNCSSSSRATGSPAIWNLSTLAAKPWVMEGHFGHACSSTFSTRSAAISQDLGPSASICCPQFMMLSSALNMYCQLSLVSGLEEDLLNSGRVQVEPCVYSIVQV